MERLANLDVTKGYDAGPAKLAAQVGFGIACAGLYVAARSIIDSFAPGSGPFALIFPPILIATLFGHWRAGFVTFVLTFLWGWYFVMHPLESWEILSLDDGFRLILNALSGVLIIFFAEVFRRAIRRAAEERDQQIEMSEMLRLELEHRTRNNLQLMQSLLAMQKRQEPDTAARAALTLASNRVGAFASTYECLPVAPSVTGMVPMQPYLSHLVDDVARAVFSDEIRVIVDIAPIELDRQTATAIGLYTNEALTNCAKHAFGEAKGGEVRITLTAAGSGLLEISDSGGACGPSVTRQGTGTNLMQVLAKQAGARHSAEQTGSGYILRLSGFINQSDQSAQLHLA